jgi:hypothetical protein
VWREIPGCTIHPLPAVLCPENATIAQALSFNAWRNCSTKYGFSRRSNLKISQMIVEVPNKKKKALKG